MNRRQSILFITQAAIIASLYVVLTWLTSLVGLANGVIQVRLSEALAILPVFTPAALPGLAIGCLLSNLLTGCMPLDILFGTLATAMGAFVCRLLCQKKNHNLTPLLYLLATLPNILSNTLIIPFVLKWVYMVEDALPFLFLTVGIGEILACGVLGGVLLCGLWEHKDRLFPR